MSEEPRKPDHPETKPVAAPQSNAPASAMEAKPNKALTPEEQMALFEKELKETDWGHQPC